MNPNIEPTNQGHRILVLALTILLTAGAVGGGVYYVLNQQNEKQNKLIDELQKKNEAKTETKTEEKKTEATAVQNETASWKTFSNENFSLKYPSGWVETTTEQFNFYEGTTLTSANKSFWVWVSPLGHGGPCFSEADTNRGKETEVTYDGFTGTKTECDDEVAFNFSSAPSGAVTKNLESGYLEIRFYFKDKIIDNTLIKTVMDSLDIK